MTDQKTPTRADVVARLNRLTEAQLCRVRERSAIIHEATGCTWAEADERALAEEVGR